MKIVVQVKLMPEAVQAAALRRTLRTVNDAANWVSGVAFERGVPREYELRKHTYAELKARGLGAQAAQHVDQEDPRRLHHAEGEHPGREPRQAGIEAPDQGRVEADQLSGPRPRSRTTTGVCPGSTTRRPSASGPPPGGSENVRFACSADALKTLREHRKGESDLIERDGVFYLIAVCEIPEAESTSPSGFIGVDLGIVNIATTSTGYRAAGRGLNRHRKRQLDLRRKLQAKGTKSAKRRLKKRSRKEQRHAANINHIISKTIVTTAERTGSRYRPGRPHGHPQTGYGSASPNGSRCTPGASTSSARSSSTRHAGPGSRWCTSIRPTPASNAPSAATSTGRTESTKPRSPAGPAGSLMHADDNASHNIARKGESCVDRGA